MPRPRETGNAKKVKDPTTKGVIEKNLIPTKNQKIGSAVFKVCLFDFVNQGGNLVVIYVNYAVVGSIQCFVSSSHSNNV